MLFRKDVPKGKGEIIRVEISEFKGQNYFNIRIWYTDKDSGEYKPTSRGVTLRPGLYSELKSAILEAEEVVQQLLAAEASNTEIPSTELPNTEDPGAS